jgi:hypothetical protein
MARYFWPRGGNDAIAWVEYGGLIPDRNNSFFWFDKPPIERDIDLLSDFHFETQWDWTIYGSAIDESAWKIAFGDKPDRQFLLSWRGALFYGAAKSAENPADDA